MSLPETCSFHCLAKDFVETFDGIFIAVIIDGLRHDKVIGFPRYRRSEANPSQITKVAARDALDLIPQKYKMYCAEFDQVLAGIPVESITQHYCPIQRGRQLVCVQRDALESKASDLLGALKSQTGNELKQTGVTGSLLVGVHGANSDIDLVSRDRGEFELIRLAFAKLVTEHPFTSEFWESYHRRGWQELDFAEFVWHEDRKHNRLNWHGTKVDLSLCLPQPIELISGRSRKVKRICGEATVLCDARAFECPAVWQIESEWASELVCWDPRYLGQARRGERIEFGAWLEVTDAGLKRLVVGSSREASGEYIRVKHFGQAAS